MMTGGQSSLSLGYEEGGQQDGVSTMRRLPADRKPLRVLRASADELAAHDERLREIDEAADGGCLWLQK